MRLICSIDNLKDKHSIVICDSNLSAKAHKDLFHFDEKLYFVSDSPEMIFEEILKTIEVCNSLSKNYLSKIHLVCNWINLFHIALWSIQRPFIQDVFTLLRDLGLGLKELQLFKDSDINDIFPYLYYGKRFDILKKLCHRAKKQTENHFKDPFVRVDCHLTAEDTKMIVASSL